MTLLSMNESSSDRSIDAMLIREIEVKKKCELMRTTGKTTLPKPPPLIPQHRIGLTDREAKGWTPQLSVMSISVERRHQLNHQPYGEQSSALHSSPQCSPYDRLSSSVSHYSIGGMPYIRANYRPSSGSPVLAGSGTRDTWHAPTPLPGITTALRPSTDYRLSVLPLNSSWLHSNGTDGSDGCDGCRPGPVNTGESKSQLE